MNGKSGQVKNFRAGRRIRWRVSELTPKTPGPVASADVLQGRGTKTNLFRAFRSFWGAAGYFVNVDAQSMEAPEQPIFPRASLKISWREFFVVSFSF